MSLLDGAAMLSRGEVCSSRPATERLASRLRAGLLLLLEKWSSEDHIILSCDVRLGFLCKLSNYTKPQPENICYQSRSQFPVRSTSQP